MLKRTIMKHKVGMELLALLVLLFFSSLAVHAEPTTKKVYLTGTGNDDMVEWDFFCTAGRNSGGWTKIGVPSCWELQGFGQFTYGFSPTEQRINESAIYKRTFDVPKAWKGKIVDIVFCGVMTDAEVLVNGTPVGEKHQGAFYEFRRRVSSMLNYGGINEIEVRVDKSSSNESVVKAERNADYWVFGGIFRPVYLEVRPQTSIATMALDARADGSFKMVAEVEGDASGCTLEARVYTADGKPLGAKFASPVDGSGKASLEAAFDSPALWTAETPNLHEVRIALKKKGRTLHTMSEKFGFRTVEVRPQDGIYLNGTKIIFRGINRHSHWPTSGRTLNDRINLEDALLIKEMNMNAVRMSHYPPDKRFLEICDSLGLYVLDELAGWQDCYDTQVGRKLVREMVLRDRNHPSIVFWDNGNEGGFNFEIVPEYSVWDLQNRHVLHPWADEELTHTYHYPTWQITNGYLFNRPKIWFPTEFSHGLYDGGHAAGLEDYWEVMMKAPLCAGGFLWDFVDQGTARVDDGGWLDTYGNMGADGIVGPYREKEGSFFTVRELWSPVQISRPALSPSEGYTLIPSSFDGRIKVENRYAFTNLGQCSFSATFEKIDFLTGKTETKTAEVSAPDVDPGKSGWLEVPMPEGVASFDVMHLRAFDPEGKELCCWTMNISSATEYAATLLASDRSEGAPLPLAGLRFVADAGEDSSIKAETVDGGWLKVTYAFSKPGDYDNVGVTFDWNGTAIQSMRWLGNGPYRVWKNRLRGVNFGLWTKTNNASSTGEVWEYPEFRGYHSDMYAADIQTQDGTLRIVFASDDLYLRILTPEKQVSRNNDNTMGTFPSGDISILNSISPVGTKFNVPSDTGPHAEPNHLTDVATGEFYLKYISGK